MPNGMVRSNGENEARNFDADIIETIGAVNSPHRFSQMQSINGESVRQPLIEKDSGIVR